MKSISKIINNKYMMKLLYISTLLILAAMVLGSFITLGINGYERAMFNDMIDGTAYKPFVYRTLVPIAVNTISAVIPGSIKTDINEYARHHFNNKDIVKKLNLDTIPFTNLSIALFILYASIIGFAWAFKKFIQSLYIVNTKFLYILTLIAVAGLPIFFKYYSYLYDLTHLFMCTVCLTMLVKKKWIYYLLLFGIATVSKETSVLLILIYVLVYRSVLPRRSFGLLLALQIFIYVVIKLIITLSFMDNPGGFTEFQLFRNLTLTPYSISQFFIFAIIAVAVAYDWYKKPVFLHSSLWILVPLIVLTCLFGFLDEYRDYYEIYPVVLLLIAHTVAKILDITPFEVRSLPNRSNNNES